VHKGLLDFAISMSANDIWDEARLSRYVTDQIEESLGIEYKSAGALHRDKKIDITKDVSAMANSEGGIIIYGVTEDGVNNYLPGKIDPVDRNQFSKEWLEQVISEIRPRIADLKIFPVQLSGNINHVAYVVEVPQGAIAHQATDKRYYRRYNFQAVPMADYEIRDVMNRRTHPKLVASARLIVYARLNSERAAGRLQFTLNNDSDVLARYVALVVHVPVKIKKHFVHYVAENIIMDETKDGHAYKLSFSNHDSAPLFPRTSLFIGFDFQLTDNLEVRGQLKFLDDYKYSVWADSMPTLSGSFTCEEILEQLTDEPWVPVK
jgi:hypothetical protein